MTKDMQKDLDTTLDLADQMATIKNSVVEKPEYVLVIPRSELEAQGVTYTGIQDFDINKVVSCNFGFLARDLIDNKSNTSIEIGKLLPQVLPYFIIKDADGCILSYNRKGKEKGLLGKNSIGVGGHIDLTDSFNPFIIGHHEPEGIDLDQSVDIKQIIQAGLKRELKEEIGLTLLQDIDFDFIIAIDSDKTSNVHIALVATIDVDNFDELTPNPEEFLEVKYLTSEELIARSKEVEYEPWSQLIIDHYA